MSIIRGRAGWRTSFPNQNKWPGQQKVNGAKPSIFLRDGGGGGGRVGLGRKQIHYHKVNRTHQHSWPI